MIQLLLLTMALTDSPQAASVPLLELGRSKNANVVVYAARVRPDGLLDDNRPFEAHWVLRAEDGRSEPLTVIEELLAYGFSWKPRAAGARLRSHHERLSRARPRGSSARQRLPGGRLGGGSSLASRSHLRHRGRGRRTAPGEVRGPPRREPARWLSDPRANRPHCEGDALAGSSRRCFLTAEPAQTVLTIFLSASGGGGFFNISG